MNELIIPKGKKIKGLYVFCNKCKAKSKSRLAPSSKCSHPIDKQVYKAIITIPGTKKVRTKVLPLNIDDAIKEILNF
mgnify:CR=1 FL=1